jgi:hypothetical protein
MTGFAMSVKLPRVGPVALRLAIGQCVSQRETSYPNSDEVTPVVRILVDPGSFCKQTLMPLSL